MHFAGEGTNEKKAIKLRHTNNSYWPLCLQELTSDGRDLSVIFNFDCRHVYHRTCLKRCSEHRAAAGVTDG